MKKHIPVSEPCLGKEEELAAAACVRSGWISSLGPNISEFEEKFSSFCGVPHGVTVANGTVALHLALKLLEIGPGDEVIVPTLTFIAVPNSVHYTGAKPVFVDSEPGTWNLDPELVEAAVTRRTKAIIAVHLYGHPCDMDALRKIAARHKLKIVEDCAEAHGALYKGRMAGGLGDIAAFSFYGNKTITLGEGGILLMRSEKLRDRARFLRDHGMSRTRRYFHPEVGFNYRITNLQCAVGLAQFKKIKSFIAAKRANAALYNSLLKDVSGITLPPEKEWAKSVYWMYSALFKKRDALAEYLSARGIDTRPFFIPMHRQPPYLDRRSKFPVADALAASGLNLPSSVKLTNADIRLVCARIKEFYASKP